MEDLAEKTCTPCRGGIPPLTSEEAERLHVQVPDWGLRDEAHRIERSFRFANFRESLAFVQRVGELAEEQSHHPDISFGWGYATVSLRTKKIKGLHENDFIMAGRIDRIFKASNRESPREVVMSERDQRIVKTATEAREGVTGHNVRYVLAVSVVCVVIAFGVLWLYFFA